MEREEGRDSFEVVKEFLTALGDRPARRDEVQVIAPALREIFERLMKVRAVAPTVDLSDRMWTLMEMVGIRKPGRAGGFRSAASFL
jgi:hypothetical protein